MLLSRRAVIGALAVTAVATGCGTSSPTAPAASGSGAAGSGKVWQIGVSQIVTHPALDAVRKGAIEELARQGFTDGHNIRVDFQNPEGDQSTLNTIAQSFSSGKKDLVLAIATPTAQAMAQAITDKPVVFAAVTDPVAAKLVKSLKAPGGNVTGTSDMNPIDKQIGLITEIVPSAKTVGIVYSSAETNSQVQVDMARTAAQKLGVTIKTATITNSSEIQQAAQSLAGGIDAYFVPTDNTVVSGLESLIQVAQEHKIPIVTADADSVKRGCIASYAVDYATMGTQTGAMIVKILQGADPATMPVEFQTDPQLTVNKQAAAKIGLTVPDAVLKAADVTV